MDIILYVVNFVSEEGGVRTAWTAKPEFNTLMDIVEGFLRKTLQRDSKSFQGLERCMIWTSSSEVATGSSGGWRAA